MAKKLVNKSVAKLKPKSKPRVVAVTKPAAPSREKARPAAKPARPAPVAAKSSPAKSPATKATASRPGAIAAKSAPPRTAAQRPVPPVTGLTQGRPAGMKPVTPQSGIAVGKPPIDGVRLKVKKKKLDRHRPDDPPVRLPPPPVTSDSKMAKNRAGLSSKELEFFRGLLMEKRRELLGDVTSMEREALRSGNTNLSNLPLHMADTGTDNYEQEFTLGLVEKDRNLLREINGALAKIQDGSYGICEGTGKPISKPRLEAQPWAKYSIEHARALEKPQFRRAY